MFSVSQSVSWLPSVYVCMRVYPLSPTNFDFDMFSTETESFNKFNRFNNHNSHLFHCYPIIYSICINYKVWALSNTIITMENIIANDAMNCQHQSVMLLNFIRVINKSNWKINIISKRHRQQILKSIQKKCFNSECMWIESYFWKLRWQHVFLWAFPIGHDLFSNRTFRSKQKSHLMIIST